MERAGTNDLVQLTDARGIEIQGRRAEGEPRAPIPDADIFWRHGRRDGHGAGGFDSVHAGRTWVVVARALTAQAPPWNYVGTPLRLRRRKQIYPKKPTWDFGIRKRRLSAQPARHEHEGETSVANAHHSPGVLRHGR